MNKGRKNNRGQVTIFIIIAVLIVALMILFFVFKNSFNIGKTSVETEPIQTNVLSCLKSTGEEGINYIALHGGYYKIPEEISFSYLAEEVSYDYLNSKENVPSASRLERELESYLNENLKSCVNFSSFEEQGFSINEGNLSSSVNINDDKINVKINYPLTIKKGENTYRLKDFKTEIASPIEKLRAASEEIVNLYSENPGFVCLSCLEDISNKYGVEAKATPIQDKNVIWFSVSDGENELNWRFVVGQ